MRWKKIIHEMMIIIIRFCLFVHVCVSAIFIRFEQKRLQIVIAKQIIIMNNNKENHRLSSFLLLFVLCDVFYCDWKSLQLIFNCDRKPTTSTEIATELIFFPRNIRKIAVVVLLLFVVISFFKRTKRVNDFTIFSPSRSTTILWEMIST